MKSPVILVIIFSIVYGWKVKRKTEDKVVISWYYFLDLSLRVCSSLISLAGISTLTKSKFGEEGIYLPYVSKSWFITEEVTRMKEESCLLACTLDHALLFFFSKAQDHLLRGWLIFPMGWYLHQFTLKTISLRHAPSQPIKVNFQLKFLSQIA